MNKLTNNSFFDVPNDLYLPMFGTQDTKKASGQKLLDTINTACVVAQTSHGAFNSVVSKLFTDHVFKSIISENTEDRSSISLHKAFAPVAKYMRFVQDILRRKIFSNANINIEQGESFFRVFGNFNEGDLYYLLQSNVVELVPLFFFKAQLQNNLPPYRAEMQLNRYRQKPLPLDYDKGVENMVRSIDPDNAREALAFIPNSNIDLLTHNLLDIRENFIENRGTTALYKAYRLFIDRIFQTDEFSHVFDRAPQWLKNDQNFMRRAIGQDTKYFFGGSVEMQHSRDLITQTLQQQPTYIISLSSNDRQDRNYVLTAMQGDGSLLNIVPEQFQKDSAVVLEAVKSSPIALHYAHEDLKKDENIVLEGIRWHGSDSLFYASKELKNNADFMLKAARIHPRCLYQSSAELKMDQDFMDAARLIDPSFQ